MEYERRSIRWLPYQASRGCPGLCAFCINVVTGNRTYRSKNPDTVIDELETISSKYRINHFKIIDDNFFVRLGWVKSIAKGLVERKLNISWDAECRVDYFGKGKIDDDYLDLLVESGLVQFSFGIESGSRNTLKIIKKGITPEQSLAAIQMTADHGIASRCSFIIDVPGENRSDIYETVRLIGKIRKLPKTMCGVHTYRPYPKSELCERLLASGSIKQPETFEEWSRTEFIRDFTYSDAERKWQKNHNLSSKISFYQNAESGFWIAPHQVQSCLVKKINNCFIRLAAWRNRKLFYGFSADRLAYTMMKTWFYRLKEMFHKSNIKGIRQ